MALEVATRLKRAPNMRAFSFDEPENFNVWIRPPKRATVETPVDFSFFDNIYWEKTSPIYTSDYS